MRRILFDSEPHHVFVFGDLTVTGGQEFLVADDDVADDLLSQPYQDLRELPFDLNALTREELNEFALRAGVTKPQKLASKEKVAEAINASAVVLAAPAPEGADDAAADGAAPDAPVEGADNPPPAGAAGDTNESKGD